jgi:hypothetical protein
LGVRLILGSGFLLALKISIWSLVSFLGRADWKKNKVENKWPRTSHTRQIGRNSVGRTTLTLNRLWVVCRRFWTKAKFVYLKPDSPFRHSGTLRHLPAVNDSNQSGPKRAKGFSGSILGSKDNAGIHDFDDRHHLFCRWYLLAQDNTMVMTSRCP